MILFVFSFAPTAPSDSVITRTGVVAGATDGVVAGATDGVVAVVGR